MNTITKNGKIYPLLDGNKDGRISCPFCNKKHTHRAIEEIGHRLTHCNIIDYKDITIEDGTIFERKNGYYVRFKHLIK